MVILSSILDLATPREQATALLSQQIWCWGQDVKRPEGNWLTEIGFQRNTPPTEHKDCSSVYTLAISPASRVVLRGFGVYIGDDAIGGLYIERYGFTPKYSPIPNLECPPWSDKDLPEFVTPSPEQRCESTMLLLRLLDWIRGYEVDIANRLGTDYRRETLMRWNNGKRIVTPAETMASSWRRLSLLVAANSAHWLTTQPQTESATT
ncbi:hypothetical protein [Neorhodopirellula pilleata]|uniref:Uncharacterized protein n=1 Tax=Neorhodopirellula pilleata TaxID=2714738 RepID=A0A5C6A9B8_9BACT|nr:hypothetical protein [Neorhodopirellula pilleata]TWT96592.1 hypothetical protein Pla100_30750 [Neorhodopirellula pilleata]